MTIHPLCTNPNANRLTGHRLRGTAIQPYRLQYTVAIRASMASTCSSTKWVRVTLASYGLSIIYCILAGRANGI